MASFTIDGPDGKSYTVEGDTAEGALAALKKHLGAAEPAPVEKPALDKYQQTVREERDALKARGIESPVSPYTRRMVHGATLGFDNALAAAALTPAEMLSRGTWDPREAYNYAKAREDMNLEDAREKTGALGGAAEVLGGAVTGGGLAKGGITFSRALAPEAGLFKRSLASAGDAAALGGIAGANEGNTFDERFANATKGFVGGGVVGGALPPALAIGKTAFAPIVANIRARSNPRGYAESQVARAVQESGKSADDISLDMVTAANEGQGVYTLADALGNPGQRMLSTVSRAPGEGRTAAVEALNSRQGDQGRRLSSALREGFDAPQTAEQTRAAMVDAANFEAGHNYAPVKRDMRPIDVTDPVAIANRSISPAADNLARAQGRVPTDLAARSGIEGSEAALRDPIGSALKEARSYLAAPTLTLSNVNQAFRAKTNIDMMIAKATENKQGALIAELVPIRDALDEALTRTSFDYAGARDAYRVAQRRIEALDLGKTIGGKPGRPEDAIDAFRALPDDEAQTAFRRGYVDPQIAQVQNAAFGTNKARPFTSDATRQEFEAFAAPGKGDEMTRRISRENTMFETRNQALGGSKTADNLADAEAMGVNPTLVGQVLTGNWTGAFRTALTAGQNVLTGNTAAVRQQVADILLQNGANVSPATLRRMVDETVRRIQFMQNLARQSGRAAAGGGAVAMPMMAPDNRR